MCDAEHLHKLIVAESAAIEALNACDVGFVEACKYFYEEFETKLKHSLIMVQ